MYKINIHHISCVKIRSPSRLKGCNDQLFTYICMYVFLYADEGSKPYALLAGIPYSSMLNPILWNAMYDSLLRLRLLTGGQYSRRGDWSEIC